MTVIITNSINSLILPVMNFIISYFVIRLTSDVLWGFFVHWLIIVTFSAHVIQWGNKEYLLREFSHNPSQIAKTWQTSLTTRSILLLVLFGVLPFLSMGGYLWIWLGIWALGLFLSQSFDVLIIYHKAFGFSIFVEGFVVSLQVLGLIAIGEELLVEHLVHIFAIATLIKAGLLSWKFWRYSFRGFWLVHLKDHFQLHFFGLALPFFLLGFSGMLQSRIDLYAVNFFLPKNDVGRYQVFINVMVYLQALANFILIPFVKNLYRLQEESIHKISIRLLGFGIIVLSPALFLIHNGFRIFFGFDFPPAFFLIGGFFVLPIYYYLPLIYQLFKENRQIAVLKINGLGIAANLILNLIMLPSMGMFGALTSTAIAQLLMLVAYLIKRTQLINRPRYAQPNY